MKKPNSVAPDADLAALRRQISDLVARNAVCMVQQAIDAVGDGQYQAIKYLFEMVGLYPAAAQDESSVQESLARILLQRLGLSEGASAEQDDQNFTASHPLE